MVKLPDLPAESFRLEIHKQPPRFFFLPSPALPKPHQTIQTAQLTTPDTKQPPHPSEPSPVLLLQSLAEKFTTNLFFLILTITDVAHLTHHPPLLNNHYRPPLLDFAFRTKSIESARPPQSPTQSSKHHQTIRSILLRIRELATHFHIALIRQTPSSFPPWPSTPQLPEVSCPV